MREGRESLIEMVLIHKFVFPFFSRNMMRKEKKTSVSEGAIDAKKVTVQIDGKWKRTGNKQTKPAETTKLVSHYFVTKVPCFFDRSNLRGKIQNILIFFKSYF